MMTSEILSTFRDSMAAIADRRADALAKCVGFRSEVVELRTLAITIRAAELPKETPSPQLSVAGFSPAEIEEAATHLDSLAEDYAARATDPACNRDHYLRASAKRKQEAAELRSLAVRAPVQLSVGSKAAVDVLAERLRQVSVEDFRTDEDDHYTSGEMAWAATCYLQNAAVAGKMQGLGLLTASDCDERGKSLPKPEAWPWDAEWWKPSGQRRDLVKAAALIIAEIERLDRAALSATATEGE